LPFRTGSFSKITMLDCIEHLEDDAAVLRELHRILAPGGMLILTVPTLPGHPPHAVFTRIIRYLPDSALLKARTHGDDKGKTIEITDAHKDAVVLSKISHEERIAAFGHCRHYTEQTMRRLVPSCGFKIEKMIQFQKLFESEMLYFHFAVKGFQGPAIYSLMRLVALLDKFLPASYPGVELLVKCRRE
jgi:SAM-dependent methyltransferase